MGGRRSKRYANGGLSDRLALARAVHEAHAAATPIASAG
jgi:hypothetical protein